MKTYSIHLPSYSIGGSDVYQRIPEICRPYGTKAVVIGGKTAMEKAKEDLLAGIAGSNIEILDFVWYGEDATFGACDALAANESVMKADIIFAVGGGRAVDTCKTLSDQITKPLFVFPTIASNCAGTTLVSIMYKEDHSFGELYFRQTPANHTFINMAIIAHAPVQYLWAGIGDALSKQYEVVLSARNDMLDHTNQLGVDLAKHCADPLLMYGEEAYADANRQKVSEALEQVVLNIIVTTGLVSVLIESTKYNGHLAHAIYYASTSFEACEKNHLHGEIVGYGILPLLMMDGDKEAFKQVYDFNQRLHLPTQLKEIGIEVDGNDYETFLDEVAADTNNIGYSPYPVTREKIDQAIRAVESYSL